MPRHNSTSNAAHENIVKRLQHIKTTFPNIHHDNIMTINFKRNAIMQMFLMKYGK